MPFSPPPVPNNGKRKRQAQSNPSSQPQPKRAAAFSTPTHNQDPTQRPIAPTLNSAAHDSHVASELSRTIHPSLPKALVKLHASQKPVIHDLTVISSSKINQKVTQILNLLHPLVRLGADGGPNQPESISKSKEDNVPPPSETGTVVRISVKSNVASKAISIVEIVKRELRSRKSKDQGLNVRLHQYNQLRGVRLPPLETQNVARGNKRKENEDAEGDAGEAGIPAAKTMSPVAETAHEELTKATPSTISSSKSATGKGTYKDAEGHLVVTRTLSPPVSEHDEGGNTIEVNSTNPSRHDHQEEEENTSLVTAPSSLPSGSHNLTNQQTEASKAATTSESRDVDVSSEGEEADANDFGTLAPPAIRAKDRERLALIAELQEGEAAKARKITERPTPVLTVYLCTRKVKGLGEELGGGEQGL